MKKTHVLTARVVCSYFKFFFSQSHFIPAHISFPMALMAMIRRRIKHYRALCEKVGDLTESILSLWFIRSRITAIDTRTCRGNGFGEI